MDGLLSQDYQKVVEFVHFVWKSAGEFRWIDSYLVVHGHSSSPLYDALGGAADAFGIIPALKSVPLWLRFFVSICIGSIKKCAGESISWAMPEG